MKFPWYKYKELPLSKRNTLQVFITNRCNLKCDGCFARNVMTDNDKDISIVEFQDAVSNSIEKGAEQINILGGEPLLHPNIISFCYFLCNRNIKTTIYTNGTLLNKYDIGDFYGAKIRVSLDSFEGSKKAVKNLKDNWIQYIDANYMITTKTTAIELYNTANMLERWGCQTFFMFNMQELVDNRDFFDCSGNDLILPVMDYKKLIHEFLKMYDGNMEIHFSKRGVFESTLSLPHNKCKFANYFIGGKIIQCPYDIINLKYQNDYEYDSRYCQQNNTCQMSKIKIQKV